ncbi:hypothetical protein KIN20_018118 [Parelaphostrongylus tenuis]|uniref:Uncharacterized protein n=1 Tax=Parelaphostrongylus tenuis TaxID=148309 RepID=A0AAD5MIZ5_PARTN|nr:hypothetical protein KIN20_018118 [Parelaphostrongylus tenuis]
MAWIDPLDAGRFQKFPFFLLVNLGPLRPCRASRAKLNFGPLRPSRPFHAKCESSSIPLAWIDPLGLAEFLSTATFSVVSRQM